MDKKRMPVTVNLTANEINAIKARVDAFPKTTFDEQLSLLIEVPGRDAELIAAANELLGVCAGVHGNTALDAAAGRLWRAVVGRELRDGVDSEGGHAD